MCVYIYIRDKPGNYGFSQFSLTAVIVILAHHLTVVRLLQVLAAFYNHKKKNQWAFLLGVNHISLSLCTIQQTAVPRQIFTLHVALFHNS